MRRSTSHPVWDEQLRLLVHVPELQALHLEVRDWDMLNASDCIGRRVPSACVQIVLSDRASLTIRAVHQASDEEHALEACTMNGREELVRYSGTL